MVVRRAWTYMAAAVVAAAVWAAVSPPGQAGAPKPGCAGDPAVADLTAGEGTIAVSAQQVVVIGSKRDGCVYRRTASGDGVPRHVAVRAGIGTAFVNDRAGADEVVVVGESGTRRIQGAGEITHPAWSPDGALAWAEDLGSLRVLDPGASEARTIAPPTRATGVFSPVFARGRLMTIAQEATAASPRLSEDDTLNNLWAYDAPGDFWRRLTSFEVSGDEWSVIRTPVVTEGGDVLFVRVHGRASATRNPSFELWMLSGGRADKIRDLPGEMYLAGMRGGRLMWNLFSPTCGDWELAVEDPGSGLRNLGCGSVLVDPVDLPDPDLLVQEEGAPQTQRSSAGSDEVALGVVIGDFNDAASARRVARRLPGASVVTNAEAPTTVRPGAFAVVVEVDGDPGVVLREVRKALPSLRDMVFVAPIGKL